MVSRKWLLGCAALLAALVLCPAQLLAGSQSGLAFGAWDLPASEREPGWCYGYLYDPTVTRPLYLFVAELQERPNPTTARTGPIYGVLYEASDPLYRPLYYVEGTWRGPRDGAQGTWSTTIWSLETFQPVGAMRGDYNDPAPFELDRWGDFSGSWAIRD